MKARAKRIRRFPSCVGVSKRLAFLTEAGNRQAPLRSIPQQPPYIMNKRISVAAVICVFALTRFGTPVRAADTSANDCFKPFTPQTKMLEFKAKKPPYRVALANGYIGNTWRIEMIKCLEAYAQDPAIKPLIKELKIVSTGTDVAAQIGAVDNFINAGYDVVLINAVSSTAFKPVIDRAKRAGVLLISYDNTIDSDQIVAVNEDQLEVGRLMGRWILKEMGNKGNVIEVRGVAGNPVDLDRHKGLREILDKEPDIKSVEVVGNWDDGTAQKAVADAIAVHGKFDGMTCQGGTTGAVRALIDGKNPFIPVAGEAENGFRKLIAEHAKEGLKGWSYGQSPALVAISLKAALAALQGNSLPQYISAPIPAVDYTNMKPGVDYFPDLSDDFFVASGFPQCNITLDAGKLMNAAKTSN
jgi:ribose transport system substrate-binding protein